MRDESAEAERVERSGGDDVKISVWSCGCVCKPQLWVIVQIVVGGV